MVSLTHSTTKMKFGVVMQQTKGFVLLIVLVYLQLLAMLNMANIRQLTMLKKQVHLQEQQSDLRANARQIMHLLSGPVNDTCVMPAKPVQFMQTQSVLWWQSHACVGMYNNSRYYFFYSDLGGDDCAQITENNGQVKRAHYYKVSLLYLAGKSVLAQQTLVLPVDPSGQCHDQLRSVMAGAGVLRWL